MYCHSRLRGVPITGTSRMYSWQKKYSTWIGLPGKEPWGSMQGVDAYPIKSNRPLPFWIIYGLNEPITSQAATQKNPDESSDSFPHVLENSHHQRFSAPRQDPDFHHDGAHQILYRTENLQRAGSHGKSVAGTSRVQKWGRFLQLQQNLLVRNMRPATRLRRDNFFGAL